MPGAIHQGEQAGSSAESNDGLFMGVRSQPLPGVRSTDVAERTLRSPISRGS